MCIVNSNQFGKLTGYFIVHCIYMVLGNFGAKKCLRDEP